jgi:hypothetical protein
MIGSMTAYFAGEKQESLLFVAAGLVAVGLAAWLLAKHHRLRAMALPLLAIACIQLIVGVVVYQRTDGQLAALSAEVQVTPAAFKVGETARMQAVMKDFSIYKTIEIALLAGGLLSMVLLRRHASALGIGAGLALQAALMLWLDLFAEARGKDYL